MARKKTNKKSDTSTPAGNSHSTLSTHKFLAGGMECNACSKIIQRQANTIKGVDSIEVDYVTGEGVVKYDSEKTNIREIFQKIGEKGYECCIKDDTPRYRDGKIHFRMSELKNVLMILGLISIAFGGYSVLHDRFDFSMPTLDQNTSLALLFVIGFFTGFHCIAMCGGFVISYSTKNAKEGKINYGAHLTYGISKTISYAFFGALFGLIGSFLTFTPLMRGVAAILAGAFLVLFGLNMLDIFKSFRRYRLRTPRFINKYISSHSDKGPATIGLLNGLMIACGPLQAIYIFAAASGSAYYGALYLAAFGLGTLPVLLGFGVLTSILSNKLTHKIVRYSGVLVVMLGLIMVNRGVALTGTGYDLNTIMVNKQQSEAIQMGVNPIKLDDKGFQEIRMDVTRYGWEPDKFVLKAGVPVKWVINGKEITGCNNAIQVPKLGLKFDIKKGEQVIEFTPEKEGTIPWSCWMGMIPGTFIVKEDINIEDTQEIKKELDKVDVPKGGSCGGACGSPSCGAATGGSCGCGGRR